MSAQPNGVLAVGAVLVGLLASPISAQQAQTKEERLYQIKLRKAEVDLESARVTMEEAKRKYEETQQLFQEELVTLSEANRTERDYERARLQYEQQKIALERLKLEFLEDATHIAVLEARKYRTPDGTRMVDITLQNASDIDQAMSLNEGLARGEVAPLLEIQNILVSVTPAGGGPVMAEPYEVIIPSLRLGEKRTLTFRLLRDLDEVGVQMRVLKTLQSSSVVLKKESLEDFPTVNSAQFAQEGQLNTKVNYDLILERLAEDEKTFRLAVLNLPQELDFAFVDPGSGASLNQVKFTETATKVQLNLQIAIPEKLSRGFIDRTMEFFMVVVDEEGFRAIGELQRKYGADGKAIPEEEIHSLTGSKVKLELIPRGQGALEVLVTNRYEEIKVGEEASVKVDVHNTGTLAVQGVRLEISTPLDWRVEVRPEEMGEIPAGEKEPMALRVVPAEGIGVGEYEIELKAKGTEGAEKVESTEKTITIRVGERANIVRNALIIGGLITVVLGLVVVTVKVSRR